MRRSSAGCRGHGLLRDTRRQRCSYQRHSVEQIHRALAGQWAGDARPRRTDVARDLPARRPAFGVHRNGDADPTVPYQQSIDLRKSLESLHVPVTMVTVPGGVHDAFPPDQTLRINEALKKFLLENHIITATPK